MGTFLMSVALTLAYPGGGAAADQYVKVEVRGRLEYTSFWLASESPWRVAVQDSFIYLIFYNPEACEAAAKLVGEDVTAKGHLALGRVETHGASRPQGDPVVVVSEVTPVAVDHPPARPALLDLNPLGTESAGMTKGMTKARAAAVLEAEGFPPPDAAGLAGSAAAIACNLWKVRKL